MLSVEGDVTFDEPWQARVFALTQSVLESSGIDRDQFRARLIRSIADDPGRPYWESWLDALEWLLSDFGLVDVASLSVG